jgi:hypothetical protein
MNPAQDPNAVHLLRVIVTEEEVHEVEVRPFDRLTVADYLRIGEPPEQPELPHELAARVFGIPERVTWIMRAHELEHLGQWYLGWLTEGAKRWEALRTVNEALNAMDNEGKAWTPQEALELLKAHGLHRTAIEVEGVQYRVPQRLEHETTWGQWLSIRHTVERHKGPEAALYPKVLAILCMPEGERFPMRSKDETAEAFDERFAAWLRARTRTFERARFVDALACCAFFLSSSATFRAIIRPSSTPSPILNKPSSAPDRSNTQSAGAPSR